MDRRTSCPNSRTICCQYGKKRKENGRDILKGRGKVWKGHGKEWKN